MSRRLFGQSIDPGENSRRWSEIVDICDWVWSVGHVTWLSGILPTCGVRELFMYSLSLFRQFIEYVMYDKHISASNVSIAQEKFLEPQLPTINKQIKQTVINISQQVLEAKIKGLTSMYFSTNSLRRLLLLFFQLHILYIHSSLNFAKALPETLSNTGR